MPTELPHSEERRASPRSLAEIDVYYGVAGDLVAGTVVELGAGGLGLTGPKQFPVGTEIELRFGCKPGCPEGLIKIKASVRFCQPGGKMGVSFVRVSATDQKRRLETIRHLMTTAAPSQGIQEGFSLIELLIVVAIILIIAAIAIPSLLAARRAANEASAVGSIRTLVSAETTYQLTYVRIGYTCNLARLGPAAVPTAAAADLIDEVLASGTKSGYVFTLSGCGAAPSSQVRIDAVPENVGQTGQRSFCTDAGGVIWFDGSGTAAACFGNQTPLQ